MLPDAWRGLVDDAAVFPPGDAPLPEALTAYVDRADVWWAELVGSFVVTDTALPDVAEDVPVSIVVTGGAGAIGGALGFAAKSAPREREAPRGRPDLKVVPDPDADAKRLAAAEAALEAASSAEEAARATYDETDGAVTELEARSLQVQGEIEEHQRAIAQLEETTEEVEEELDEAEEARTEARTALRKAEQEREQAEAALERLRKRR